MHCIHCSTAIPEGFRFCPACGADTSDPEAGPQTDPSLLSAVATRLRNALGERYELGRVLGRGGMGIVYLAREVKLDRTVAIKVLPPDYTYEDKFLKRFEREARMAAKLDHPNVIPVYAVEDVGDLHYFVMKYVEGHSLADELHGGAQLTIPRVKKLLSEAAAGLAHAHRRGIIHRDVKPANILIDDDGRALLSDFGISKALEATTQFTQTGAVVGTPHYLSPEAAKGQEVDGRSDQYSLAVVGYRLLTGRLPFEGDSVHAIIYKHMSNEQPAPLAELRPDAPGYLALAIHRALSKQPDDRFASMEEFGAAVRGEVPDAQLTPDAVSGAVTIPTARPTAKRARRRALLGVGAVTAAGAIAVTAVLLGSGERGEPEAAPGVLPMAVEDSGPGSDSSEMMAAVPAETTAAPSGPAPAEPDPAPPRAAVTAPQTRPQEQAPVDPTPAPVGYLTVGSDPWGTVSVDGVEIGNTTVLRHRVPPGRHIVEIRRAGCETTTDTVEVQAGNTHTVRKALRCG